MNGTYTPMSMYYIDIYNVGTMWYWKFVECVLVYIEVTEVREETRSWKIDVHKSNWLNFTNPEKCFKAYDCWSWLEP